MEERNILQDKKTFYKVLAVVVLPIALQSLISSSLSLVDNLMVGSLGEAELSAVGLATQMYFVHWMVMFGFCSGCATFMSQFFGTKDMKSLRKVVGFAITVAICISSVFFLVAIFFPEGILRIFTNIPISIELGKDYVRTGAICFLCIGITVPFTTALRVTEQAKLPLKISTLAFLGNTCLNYIFIFGHFGVPAMGVKGAALATAICRIFEMSMVLFVVFGRKNLLAAPLSEFFGWNKRFVSRIIHNCIPTTLNEALWSMGTTAYNAAYGRMGVTEFAAIQAGSTVLNLFTLAVFSLGDGAMILVGQELGRQRYEEAYQVAKRIMKIGIVVGLLAGLILILLSAPISTLFNFTPEGHVILRQILSIYGVFMAVKLFSGISVTGPLRAGGDTKFAMLGETASMWLVGVPMVFLGALYFQLPVAVVVLMSMSEEIVKLTIMSRRFISKKWVNNVIVGLDDI